MDGIGANSRRRFQHDADDRLALDDQAIITENSPFFRAKPRVPSIGSMTQSRGPDWAQAASVGVASSARKASAGKRFGQRLEDDFLRFPVRGRGDRRRGVGDGLELAVQVEDDRRGLFRRQRLPRQVRPDSSCRSDD